MREMLQSKIHKAIITVADISYEGSITIDHSLMQKVDLWDGQKVLIVSNTTGVRLETYVIKGSSHTGIIGINGAAAHLIKKGEEVIIIGFEWSTTFANQPKCILVDSRNHFVKYL